jgi:hypothetical protein
MPRPLSEEQIKEKLKRGDKYKSHVTERGLKPDGVTEYKKVSTWVTLECGGNGPNCKVLFPLVMGKSYMGHCPPCNRDEVAFGQIVPIESYVEALESIGFSIDNAENYVNVMTILDFTCPNGHPMSKSMSAFLKSNRCEECRDEGFGFNILPVPKALNNRQRTDRDAERLLAAEAVPAAQPIDLLEMIAQTNQRFIRLEPAGAITYRCVINHIQRKKPKDIIDISSFDCNACMLGERSTSQCKTQEEAANELSEHGATLLSTYANDKTLLELQCDECDAILYKTMNNYITKNSRCEACLEANVTSIERDRSNLAKGIQFILDLASSENRPCTTNDDPSIYKNNRSVFVVVCNKAGHVFPTCQDNYVNRERGCPYCAYSSHSEMFRTSPEDAQAIAKSRNLKLLNFDFRNVKDLCRFHCLTCSCYFNTSLDSVKWKLTGCPACNGSLGEQFTRKCLTGIDDITFTGEYRFPNMQNLDKRCRDKRDLPFDFHVKVGVEEREFVIEFDGIQHFKSIPFFGGATHFKSTRDHDLIKTNHCMTHNIPLLRIAHKDIRRIDHYVNVMLDIIRTGQYNNVSIYSDPDLYGEFAQQYADTYETE